MIAKEGQTVLVHYTGKLDDGEEFDSSVGGSPLRFTIGAGNVIAGFDAAVLGLKEGESVTVRMEPKDAYGEHSEDFIIEVPKDEMPENIPQEEGLSLMLHTENGPMEVTISKITEESVMLDANHPLAGKALNFDIELVKILNEEEASACSDEDCESCGCGCGCSDDD